MYDVTVQFITKISRSTDIISTSKVGIGYERSRLVSRIVCLKRWTWRETWCFESLLNIHQVNGKTTRMWEINVSISNMTWWSSKLYSFDCCNRIFIFSIRQKQQWLIVTIVSPFLSDHHRILGEYAAMTTDLQQCFWFSDCETSQHKKVNSGVLSLILGRILRKSAQESFCWG